MRLPRSLVGLLLLLSGSHAIAAPELTTDSLFRMAEDRFSSGAYSEALNLHMQVLRITEQSPDCDRQANSMLAVGKMHYYLQQRRTAFAWFAKTLRLAGQCGIDSIRAKALMNLGAICTEFNQPDSALLYYDQASALLQDPASLFDAKRKNRLLANLYCTMAETWYQLKNNKRMAYHYVALAEAAGRISGEYLAMSFPLIKRGIFTMLDGDCAAAEQHFRAAWALSQKAQSTEEIVYAMSLLAEANNRCGKSAEAYTLVRSIQQIRDSIFKAETAEKTAHYAILYETEKKDKENKLLAEKAKISQLRLQNEVKTRNILLLSSVGGLLLLLAVFAAVYNRYRLKKNEEMSMQLAAAQLLRFRSVMETEERERIRIAREMHDGIGYLLSAARLHISALEPADADETTAVRNATTLIDDAVKEVRAISHNLMPASLTELGLLPALRELCRRINDAGKLRVTMEVGGAPLKPDDSTEIALYRVVQEAMGNVLRHARATQIRLAFIWEAAGIDLTITDDGVGFHTGLIEESEGIGWKNIFSRIDMLHGKTDIQSTPGAGSAIHIRVPL